MNGRHHFRKPDPLLLLVAAITLGAVMSTTVNAAEPVIPSMAFRQPELFSTFDGNGFRLSRIGDTNAGLHVSLQPPAEVEQTASANSGSQQDLKDLLDVYLSVRLPW